tara:strand:+ start:3223 stop:4827 length:1605 start_codon:yes stop_codon:yes gene_type:complete
MIILGIHGGFTLHQHDAAASLMIDGKLICSIEEERLYRQKNALGLLPINAIQKCLDEAKVKINDVNLIALPGATYDDLEQRTKEWITHYWGYCPQVLLVNHQTAHIASSFFQSGYEESMCLTMDAFGDNLSAALAIGSKKDGLKILETRPYTNSLGLFYATMTHFIGFKNMDEFKVMGLAAYGKPNIDLSFFCKEVEDGYLSDFSYFRKNKEASHLEPFFSSKLVEKLGEGRKKNQPLNEHYINLAASTQNTLERCAVSLVKYIHKLTGKRKICISGGVGLNCSMNKKINELDFIDEIFVQPASSDRGLSLGCALYASNLNNQKIKPIKNVFYGPSYSDGFIEEQIKISGINYKEIDDTAKIAAEHINSGKIIARYNGRSEFGPRSLGNRSILANPTLKNMKEEINKRIKFREEFRPFAPSVLNEKSKEIFNKSDLPFMTIATDVNDKWAKKLPSTTHVNNTARVQTVDEENNKNFYDIISNFEKISDVPVVLNTSFNIRGQPIVETPLEAISTFAGNGIDSLFLGNFLIEKKN